MLLVGLVFGIVWSLKPARSVSEIALGLLPAAVFFAASRGPALFFEGWAEVGVTLAGQLFACFLVFPIGHRVRARRMREVIEST